MKTVKEIMREGFLFFVPMSASVSAAVRIMATHNVGIVIVLDGDAVAGVFSERDVVKRVVDRGLDPTVTAVGDVMTREIVTAAADEDYQSAIRRMDQANIRHLLVVSDGHPLSMISIRDLLRVDMQDAGDELRTLREYLYQAPPAVTRSV